MPTPAKTSPPASHPLIIVAGEELFLRTQHLSEIQSTIFGADDPGMGLIRLDAAAMNADAAAAILDEVRTPSMFAPAKLVFVDPADPLFKKTEDQAPTDRDEDGRLPNREIFENYLASPAPSATLVLVCAKWPKTTRLHKQLDKAGAIRWCEPVKANQVFGWIVRRARQAYGKGIDATAAGRLAELIGPDLQRLDNELAKLSLYEPEAGEIKLAAVNALVGFQHEQEIWDMINALAAQDAPTALKKIDEIWSLDSKIEYMATGAVFTWLSQVLKARELLQRRMPDATVARELKLWPPDRSQKVLSMAHAWNANDAARWSAAILQMDLANKSSLGEARLNLEKFVVQLCSG